VDTLKTPDLPVEGVHFEIETLDLILSRQKVSVDAIGLAEGSWTPRAWQ
jgi:hypothetical protein